MLDFLVRKFVPDYKNVEEGKVREAYSLLAGALGVVLNLVLFAVKLPIGMISGSIAITSDAFNNISDMGSSLITIIGMRLAGRRPDREHPFGHGRLEYVSALIVSFIILLVGFELLKESLAKLWDPEPVSLSPALVVILLLSVLVKLWMFLYNRKLGARINSSVLRATASDSLNDVITTSATIGAVLLGTVVSWPVDAVAGLAVSLLILYSGYSIAKDTIDLLLGGKPDPELVKKLGDMVLKGKGIVGVHDLIVHDYGPGRLMASVHAEVPDDGDVTAIHESIDATEQRILHELGVPIVIHMDPIKVNCERTNAVRDQVARAVEAENPAFTMHDFRMTDGERRINLIFDLVVPCEMPAEARERAVRDIKERMSQVDARYRCVIHVDDNYAT